MSKCKNNVISEIKIKFSQFSHIHLSFIYLQSCQLETFSTPHLTQSSHCDGEDSAQRSIVISLLKRKELAAWSRLAPEVGICETDTLMWILLFSVTSSQLLHCCAITVNSSPCQRNSNAEIPMHSQSQATSCS